MKSTIFKRSIYVTLFILSVTSCELFTNQAIKPGISIFKTRGDYFDLVTIGMKGEEVFRTSAYLLEVGKFIITNSDTVYRNRIRLINGYILASEADERYDVFLNLTFKQHMSLEKNYPGGIPHDTLKKYIIDKDPYTEYYRDMSDPRKFSFNRIEDIDTTVINRIIKEGKIEEFFRRIK